MAMIIKVVIPHRHLLRPSLVHHACTQSLTWYFSPRGGFWITHDFAWGLKKAVAGFSPCRLGRCSKPVLRADGRCRHSVSKSRFRPDALEQPHDVVLSAGGRITKPSVTNCSRNFEWFLASCACGSRQDALTITDPGLIEHTVLVLYQPRRVIFLGVRLRRSQRPRRTAARSAVGRADRQGRSDRYGSSTGPIKRRAVAA